MSRAVMQQAIEALAGVAQWVEKRPDTHPWDAWQRVEPAIAALKQALAEPEQGPVEQALEALNKMQSILMMKDGKHPRDVLRAFIQQSAPTPQPEQKPVAWYYERGTDKGISFAPDRDPYKDWQPLYTAPPEAVEPIAWMVYTDGGASAYVTDNPNDLIGAYRALPLYTSAPTPRKPVELTDEEIDAYTMAIRNAHPLIVTPFDAWCRHFSRAVIAAYERKNGITGEQT